MLPCVLCYKHTSAQCARGCFAHFCCQLHALAETDFHARLCMVGDETGAWLSRLGTYWRSNAVKRNHVRDLGEAGQRATIDQKLVRLVCTGAIPAGRELEALNAALLSTQTSVPDASGFRLERVSGWGVLSVYATRTHSGVLVEVMKL